MSFYHIHIYILLNVTERGEECWKKHEGHSDITSFWTWSNF